MMELFIRIKDGQPFEHPIFGDNFREAFPEIDVNNLPPEFARFERVQRPEFGVYDVWISEDPTYELVDGVYKDVWHKRNMTAEEKAAKQQAVKDEWASLPDAQNFLAWTFDEDKCAYVAPVAMPADGKPYFWQGTTSSWVLVPKKPEDGKRYKIDYASATWVEIA